MLRKIVVFLVILVLLLTLLPLTTINIKASTPELVPDIITKEVIFLSPESNSLINSLRHGCLGVVTYSEKGFIGIDVVNNYVGTELLVKGPKDINITITTPVALKLEKDTLLVYFDKMITIKHLKWDCLSIPNDKEFLFQPSWFPKIIALQIVNIEPTNVTEKHINYCCNPPIQEISYGYRIFANIPPTPFEPTKELSNAIIIDLMIPEYLVDTMKTLVANRDFIWLEIDGDNQIYIWLSH